MSDIYKTTNLSLAGYFAHEGIHPATIEENGPMKSRPGLSIYAICYAAEEYQKLKSLEMKFFSDQAVVNPKRYDSEKKSLKELIDTNEGMRH